MSHSLSQVVDLSNALGHPSADMAILAEGNVSGRADAESFYIKASGFSLATLQSSQVVKVFFKPYLDLTGDLTDTEVKDFLVASRAEETHLIPSVETFMHAYLLSLPEVNFVGHTHPTALVSLLALERAEELSTKKIFPDDIVCCGPASPFVPYVDPGLPLARAIQKSVTEYVRVWQSAPKTIWLANHGLIAIGKNPSEVENASKMAVKAARSWLGALSSGQKINDLTPDQIARIHNRPDEHYRQRILAATQKL